MWGARTVEFSHHTHKIPHKTIYKGISFFTILVTDHLFGTLVRTIPWLDYPVLIPVPPPHHDLTIHRLLQSNSSSVANADNELLESVDESTLRSFCKTYSLSSTGTKVEMLSRLRIYASERAEADRRRQLGRRGRVESNLEGKARHALKKVIRSMMTMLTMMNCRDTFITPRRYWRRHVERRRGDGHLLLH